MVRRRLRPRLRRALLARPGLPLDRLRRRRPRDLQPAPARRHRRGQPRRLPRPPRRRLRADARRRRLLPAERRVQLADRRLARGPGAGLAPTRSRTACAPGRRRSARRSPPRSPRPGKPAGSLDATALAVGQEGGVLRYSPGAGWTREFLLASSGAVSKPLLRGVAWPEPGRAHAVGDLGAMWMWRAETGLWERDPAAPVGFEANLMGVAFEPGDPLRGYAVGKEGALLRYDKTWTQEPLPEGFADADLTSVAFAGAQALVAAGARPARQRGRRAGTSTRACARCSPALPGAAPQFVAVAGLPDGGAVAAGLGFVIERDGPAAPWRFSTQPLLGVTPVALAAFRSGGAVRALAAVQPQLPYPVPDVLPETGPDSPPPLVPPFPLPGDGYLVRETDNGWRDEQRTAFAGSTSDRPVKSDPIGALLVDGDGEGWALGGWSGESDAAGRGNGNRSTQGRDRPHARADRRRPALRDRRAAGAAARARAHRHRPRRAPSRASRSAATPQCESPCADLRDESLGPDRTLRRRQGARPASSRPSPAARACCSTPAGASRPRRRSTAREAARYAELLQPGAPAYAAPSAADTASGNATAFSGAFAGAPAPFGSARHRPGVTPLAARAAAAVPGARTHYAFDSAGYGGTVRVIVIDNSRGSLAASDPHQNPPEPQLPWLRAALADARAQQHPGDRRRQPRPQLALPAAASTSPPTPTRSRRLLVDDGASAYFFERPEENRVYPIPSGAADDDPGLRHRHARLPLAAGEHHHRPRRRVRRRRPAAGRGRRRQARPGDQPRAGRRAAAAGRSRADAAGRRRHAAAPLAAVAVPGPRPAAGRRRPLGARGRRRRPAAARLGPVHDASRPQPCAGPACATRIAPEYEFTSSDPGHRRLRAPRTRRRRTCASR